MKKLLPISFWFFVFGFSFLAYAGGGRTIESSEYAPASMLADMNLIVRQDDLTKYRIGDSMLRQELIGTALKLGSVDLLENYVCKGYFADAGLKLGMNDAWVCRAFELGADRGFVTRANKTTRPRDKVTRAEALAIVVQSSKMTVTPSNFTSNWLKNKGFADWQTKLLESIGDCRIYNQGDSCEDGASRNSVIAKFRPNDPATRGEVFEMMYYTEKVQTEVQKSCDTLLAQFLDSDADGLVVAFDAMSEYCPGN